MNPKEIALNAPGAAMMIKMWWRVNVEKSWDLNQA